MSRNQWWSFVLAAASVSSVIGCTNSTAGAQSAPASQPSSTGSGAATSGGHGDHADGSEIVFQPGPASFPAGSQIAVLQGNPGGTGEFTVRLKWPAGYKLPPHFHPTDENVTVLSGTFLVGMGDEINLDKTLKLDAQGFITAPAQAHHYAVAKSDVMVQVHGLGPFAITYVNPKDDPRNKGN
jgi:quercetin dioxygenase-like cupin family protein